MGPKINIKGKVQDMKKKEINIKPMHSNFLLTINTNQQYKDGDAHLENDIEVFDKTINSILSNVQKYIKIPETDHFDEKVKDIDIDYVIEKGTKKGQLHTHVMFKFKHKFN